MLICFALLSAAEFPQAFHTSRAHNSTSYASQYQGDLDKHLDLHSMPERLFMSRADHDNPTWRHVIFSLTTPEIRPQPAVLEEYIVPGLID